MKLTRLLKRLKWAGNQELSDVLAVGWEASEQCCPDSLPFLLPESVHEACRALALPDEARNSLLHVAEAISSDSCLRALAWHLHYCAFGSATYPWWGPIGKWPSVDALDRFLEGDGRTFYLLILTSGLPGMEAIYGTRGIPYDVFRDTLGQLKDEIADLHQTHGVWGVAGPDRVQWYRFPLRGELFRLGRLSFQFGLFGWPVRVFRHQVSGSVVALAEGGVSFLPSGQANGPGRVDATGEWMSELTATDDGVIGHPILPTGRALSRTMHLPAVEWRQVLARNDPALYFHIPGGSPLAPDLCSESFGLAMEFFQRHFPDKPYVCFCCDSWVLNSQLQDLLPPSSNLVRFQREIYLLPHITDDAQLKDVILAGAPEDLGKVPRRTELQRSLLDFLTSGGCLHASAGAGFLLPEDFRWGEQVYVRQRWPWFDG